MPQTITCLIHLDLNCHIAGKFWFGATNSKFEFSKFDDQHRPLPYIQHTCMLDPCIILDVNPLIVTCRWRPARGRSGWLAWSPQTELASGSYQDRCAHRRRATTRPLGAKCLRSRWFPKWWVSFIRPRSLPDSNPTSGQRWQWSPTSPEVCQRWPDVGKPTNNLKWLANSW